MEIEVIKDKALGIRSLEISDGTNKIQTPLFGFTGKDVDNTTKLKDGEHAVTLPNSLFELVWEFKDQNQLNDLLDADVQKKKSKWLKAELSRVSALIKNVSLQFGSKVKVNLDHVKALQSIQENAAIGTITIPLIPNMHLKEELLSLVKKSIKAGKNILPQYYLQENDINHRRNVLNTLAESNIQRLNIVVRSPNSHKVQYEEINSVFKEKDVWLHGTQLWNKATGDADLVSMAHLLLFSAGLDSFTFSNRPGGGGSKKASYFDEGTYAYKRKSLTKPVESVRSDAVVSTAESFKNLRENIAKNKAKESIKGKNIFNSYVKSVGIRTY